MAKNRKTQLMLKQSDQVNSMLIDSFPKTCTNFSTDARKKEMKDYVKFILNAAVLTPNKK